ncbi:MFS general substrate transporter [Trichoderma cornu-damae]|uniref:MFS general substrate transporter n=1 Tax=Trichoderma cornu-damae TaxID=654480 RepID=A0A9P8QM55_9HYPO|nr:MFS general substrate transporter [Trichoderma cornu-damae]
MQDSGPIGLVSLLIFLVSWPGEETRPHARLRSWKRFDFAGTVLGIAASALVVFAFQNAGESGPGAWKSAVFIAPITVGLACWMGLFAWAFAVDKWFAHSIVPIFPVQLFQNRLYTRSTITTLLMGYPHLLLIFCFPIRMQVVSGRSPLIAGLTMLPMLGTVALGSMVSGKVNANNNNNNNNKSHLAETMRCGTWLMALGCVLLTTVRGSEDDAKALGYLAFAGFGFGLCTAAATNVIGVEVPTQQRASAHGIVAQARILGGSLGLSVSTVCLHTEVINRLPDILTPGELASFDGDVKRIMGDSLEAIQLAYVSAFRRTVLTAGIIACCAVMSTFYGSRLHREGLHREDDEQGRHEETALEETQPRATEPLIPFQDVVHPRA